MYYKFKFCTRASASQRLPFHVCLQPRPLNSDLFRSLLSPSNIEFCPTEGRGKERERMATKEDFYEKKFLTRESRERLNVLRRQERRSVRRGFLNHTETQRRRRCFTSMGKMERTKRTRASERERERSL